MKQTTHLWKAFVTQSECLAYSYKQSAGERLQTITNSILLFLLALLLLMLINGKAPAQLPIDIERNTNGKINALAIQPDGKFLVGGEFTNIAGQPRVSIARFNSDGTLDTTFNASASGGGSFSGIRAIALQPDGKILIGGKFTSVNGQPRILLARLLPDGTLDNPFNPVFDIVSNTVAVSSLVVLPNGKILAGGRFGAIDGRPRICLARFNADGSLDTDFDAKLIIDTQSSANQLVSSIAVESNGKILIAGRFVGAGDLTRSCLVR